MEVKFKSAYIKALSKLPKHIVVASDEVVESLRNANSLQASGVDYKKLIGEEILYKIRIGGYRIIAEYENPNILMLIIIKRGDAYKKKTFKK